MLLEWLSDHYRCQRLMRRLFSLIVVLAVSGLVPLAAYAGSCTTPCCRAHASDKSMDSPSCCNETSCAPASNEAQATTDLAKNTARPSSTAVEHVELSAVCSITPNTEPAAAVSPPSHQRRLAALSTLLI
jgi:hypothetical protein